MTIKFDNPRESLLVVEAITFAIEGMSRLPEVYRPERDIDDLKELLNAMTMRDLALHQATARRRLKVLLELPPEPPEQAGL